MFLGRRKPPAENTGPDPWEQARKAEESFNSAVADIEGKFDDSQHTLGHIRGNILTNTPLYAKQKHNPMAASDTMDYEHALRTDLNKGLQHITKMEGLVEQMKASIDELSKICPHLTAIETHQRVKPMEEQVVEARESYERTIAPVREQHPELFPAPRT